LGAEKDGDLLTNQLTCCWPSLRKCKTLRGSRQASSVGLVDDWNVYGVDFKAGVNTQAYKYYIDFAAK